MKNGCKTPKRSLARKKNPRASKTRGYAQGGIIIGGAPARSLRYNNRTRQVT